MSKHRRPEQPLPCPFCGAKLKREPLSLWEHEPGDGPCIADFISLETDEDVALWNRRVKKVSDSRRAAR
jgi:hypothetical protein